MVLRGGIEGSAGGRSERGGTWRARAGTRKSVGLVSGGGGTRVVCAGRLGKGVWS